MSTLRRGTGFHTDVDALHLEVEVRHEGWNYRILKTTRNEVIKNWTLPPHAGTSKYGEPENTKFHAISEALIALRRLDDPHKVLAEAGWTPYGPGHREPSPR